MPIHFADHPWFSPAILSPGFLNPVCNAIADADLDFLTAQLIKHHFVVHALPAGEMHDEHGFRLHLGRTLGVPHDAKQDASLVPDLVAIFAGRAARRVALIARDADRLIEADVQRALSLIESVQRAATALATMTPPTQLLLFLAGPPTSFRPVEPSAKRRAEAERGPKAMTTDFDAKSWSRPRDFDLRPHHQFAISPAAWYYASLGRRATTADDRWHGVEEDDTITFYRAADGAPCIAGIFAKTAAGMRLVGVRYETDESVYRFPWEGEDPFTLFHSLCERLLA